MKTLLFVFLIFGIGCVKKIEPDKSEYEGIWDSGCQTDISEARDSLRTKMKIQGHEMQVGTTVYMGADCGIPMTWGSNKMRMDFISELPTEKGIARIYKFTILSNAGDFTYHQAYLSEGSALYTSKSWQGPTPASFEFDFNQADFQKVSP